LGGSSEAVDKLKDGMSTRLAPGIQCVPLNMHGNKKDHMLVIKMEASSKKIDVSGGEKQRFF
jgi:hypothetical protein